MQKNCINSAIFIKTCLVFQGRNKNKIKFTKPKTDRTHQNLLPCHKLEPCVWSNVQSSILYFAIQRQRSGAHNQPALNLFSLLPTKFRNLKVCAPIWRLLEGEGVFIKRVKLNDFFLLWSGECERERESAGKEY